MVGALRASISEIAAISAQPQNVAILAHAITKEEASVPPIDIERAIARKLLFEEDPEVHAYVEEQEDGQD